MVRFGRATLYMLGLVVMFFCLIATGALGFFDSPGASMGVGALLVFQTFVNMTTVGPVCYPIVAETPSGKLRAKTITIGRIVYNLTGRRRLRVCWTRGVADNDMFPRHLFQFGDTENDLADR